MKPYLRDGATAEQIFDWWISGKPMKEFREVREDDEE